MEGEIKLEGKYCKDCIIYHPAPEEACLSQVLKVCNHPAFEHTPIRIMPDCHAGAGCVIGFTAPIGFKVIPNIVGVDIGCGMLGTTFKRNTESLKTIAEHLDTVIRKQIPFGCTTRKTPLFQPTDFIKQIMDVSNRTGQNIDYVLNSIGTLGGGNHFIEAGTSDHSDDFINITIHSGSRNFGLKIANYYQKLAVERGNTEYGKELAWLEGEDKEMYLHDMRVAQKFASVNRREMMMVLKLAMHSLDQSMALEECECVHNYIGEDDIIRKGAISAKKGEYVIIPWNMRDGLIIGQGKGNESWNNSAPHGAGRVLSRSKAKELLDVDQFKQEMEKSGVYSTCVSASTLDESPWAYKNHQEIEQYLEDSVEVIHRIKPFFNFKG